MPGWTHYLWYPVWMATKAKPTYFFATRADLEPGLQLVEQQHSLQYVLTGSFATPHLQAFPSALEIPQLGVAASGDWIQEPQYLVLDRGTTVEVRPVPQRRGGVRYLVDTEWNPTGILFRPGGLFDENTLIAGEVTGVGDPRSLRLHRAYAQVVLAGFAKLQEFLVGPEAARLLDAGMRLTQRVQAPTECDLKRPPGTT